MRTNLILSNISYTYPESVEPQFNNLSIQFHTGWTGITGPNGCGKTTLLKLICGLLTPLSGNIDNTLNSVYCEQRTDYVPVSLYDLLYSYDRYSLKLKNNFEINEDWIVRWDTLSFGEKKRAQIASALFLKPDILALDEPSNHIDHKAKIFLLDSLKYFNGIGLIISHDREFLDKLSNETVFILPGKVKQYSCNYSTAEIEFEKENNFNLQRLDQLTKKIKNLKKEVETKRDKADHANKERYKRGISLKDHDAKSKINLARLTGKDAIAGKQYRKVKNRFDSNKKEIDSIEVIRKKEQGIIINDNSIKRYFPVFIKNEIIKINKEFHLHIPDLSICEYEKIGITGDNGTGKSTFIKKLISNVNMPDDKFIYIPQELDIIESKLYLEKFNSLDNSSKTKVMTIIDKLGSDAKRILTTVSPSPGELRKMLIAIGLMKNPSLIILDEPTNHMDLVSIKHLEDALNECNCSMLLVSHDFVFLKNTVSYNWGFIKEENKKIKIIRRYIDELE